MKNLILLFAFTLTLVSCDKNGGGSYTINGIAPGFKNGTKVILQRQSEDGKSTVSVDTVAITNEKFEITGEVDEPALHGIAIENARGLLNLIVEKGDIKINVNRDTIFRSKIAGTYNNEEFQKFTLGISKLQKSVKQKLTDFEAKNATVMTEAQKTNDTLIINRLRKEYSDIQKAIGDYSINYSKNNPKSFISLLIVQSLLNNPEYDLTFAKKSFESLDASLKDLKPAKKLKEFFEKVAATEVGEKAPDFTAKDIKGKEVSLNQSLGEKVTIIDFWASWCMPCRKENPNMVALYKEFHAKGLNIVGVSLDNDSKDWITAIAKDQLTWTHVSNLKQWEDPIAKLYNVNQIPATFVLDKDGKIIARDINGAELRKKVAELISK